jgi:hypothetical protein
MASSAGIRPWRLFLAAFLLYNLNLRPMASGDTTPAALIPFSILLDGSLALDRFESWYAAYDTAPYYFTRLADGGLHSAFPITLPVLLTPLYAPLAWVADLDSWPIGRLVLLARAMEKITASLVAAASVAAFFALARRMTAPGWALALTLVYGLGSGTWTISSQALWQHGASELLVILSLAALLEAEESGGRVRHLALAGCWAGLSAAIRPTDAVFLAASAAMIARAPWGRTPRIAWAACALPLAAAPYLYNLAVFGHVFGGYRHARFTGELWAGLLGLLASPSRGLLVYSPVFLFAAAGAYRWLRQGARPYPRVFGTTLLFALLHIALMAKWPVWWGGHGYGPRLLTDIVPCLTLLLIPAVPMLEPRRALRHVFVASVAVSVAVQAAGAFCYPNGDWETVPRPVEEVPARLWDWTDSQIARTAVAGPISAPYRLAGQVLTGRAGKPERALADAGVRWW